MPVVRWGLEAWFTDLDGVPGELLLDPMKAVMVRDGGEEGGGLIENREFVRFRRHWGFRVRACPPDRVQTKGKVERPVRDIRESFFQGRDFVSDDDLNARVRKWREEAANVRNHGTLKERPGDQSSGSVSVELLWLLGLTTPMSVRSRSRPELRSRRRTGRGW